MKDGGRRQRVRNVGVETYDQESPALDELRVGQRQLFALPEELRLELARCLENMHGDPVGAEILAEWGIAELRRVSDADYDPIRLMARIAVKARPGGSAASVP